MPRPGDPGAAQNRKEEITSVMPFQCSICAEESTADLRPMHQGCVQQPPLRKMPAVQRLLRMRGDAVGPSRAHGFRPLRVPRPEPEPPSSRNPEPGPDPDPFPGPAPEPRTTRLRWKRPRAATSFLGSGFRLGCGFRTCRLLFFDQPLRLIQPGPRHLHHQAQRRKRVSRQTSRNPVGLQ